MKRSLRILQLAFGALIAVVAIALFMNGGYIEGSVVVMTIPALVTLKEEDFKALTANLQTEAKSKIETLFEEAKKGDLSALNELKTKFAEFERKFYFEDKPLPEYLKNLQAQADALEVKMKGIEQNGTQKEAPSLEIALKNLFNSKEFKDAKAGKFRDKGTFELKASTSNITGTVNMTMQNLTVRFAPERALAFMPFLNTGTVGANSNRVLWVEGSYTSNVGYVGEGTGQTTADSGSGVEKTRAMAKISAKLPLTAELLEDAEYVASALRMKMQEKAMLFVDKECYSGDGNDTTQPNHLYGIVGHATAYNITTTGSTGTVSDANIGDLVNDAILQAELSEQRGLNVVWMHPKDFARFRKAKDGDGQYLFVKDVNGNYTINGLSVVRSTAVTANTMTLADTGKIQLWWKRNPEIKFSQMNGTDFVDDNYTAVMFLRNQVVVEGPDKTAIIHVADIDAAIGLLNKL